MKKYLIFSLFALCSAVITPSCSDDIPAEEPTGIIEIEKSETAAATTYSVAVLDPKLNLGSSATYVWSMETAASELYALTATAEEKALFLTANPGTYVLKLLANKGAEVYTRHFTVTVGAPATAPSPYIAKVYDFLPAPGQFTNDIPKYVAGDTKEAMIARVKTAIAGAKNPGLISLGGFGGYVVFGFDHTIVNVPGKRDFRVMGNAFFADGNPNPDGSARGGSCEPGTIMVAYDANKNGVPDADEWCEIAGSEYHKPTTIKNYEMTYYRPLSEESTPGDDQFISIRNYIRWTDNQGATGYKVKNSFHAQSYYPGWITDDQITYKGTLLASNSVNESDDPEAQYWVLYAYGFGYADNVPNTDDDSAIDISWAVNAKGEKVELPGIDFVKIQNGVSQESGWLGENSTEVSGAYDLHLAGESIDAMK